MRTSENVEQLFKAYVDCSPELINIGKDSKGYGYDYTSLEKLIEHTKPILHKHGLAIIQMNIPNGILTRMVHTSGEWMESTFTGDVIKLAKMNDYQVQGSQSTYYRRYSWASICGIASDEDMDAQGEQATKKAQPKQEAKATQDQVTTITSLLSDKGIDVVAFLKYYKVNTVSELTPHFAEHAIKTLSEK